MKNGKLKNKGEFKIVVGCDRRELARKYGATDDSGANAADIIVKFLTGTKWAIRVKRKGNNGVDFRPAIPGATAVIAEHLPRGRIAYYSARTGRKLTPPRRHAR